MIGGTVIHWADDETKGQYVEIQDGNDISWRHLSESREALVGDSLWWISLTGFLSRSGEFTDRNVGRCVPCDAPTFAPK